MIRDVKLKYQPHLVQSSSRLRMRADALQRGLTARILRSPFGRLKNPSITYEKLLLVPRDLRAADTGFWDELQNDRLAFGETLVELHGASIFDVHGQSDAFMAQLHTFSWLNDLKASEEEAAYEFARKMVVAWIEQNPAPKKRETDRWSIEATARRLINWLSHSDLVMHGCSEQEYHAIRASMETQTDHLLASTVSGKPGVPRLVARIALVFVGLCVKSEQDHLEPATQLLEAELSGQLYQDGGHISRNMAVLPELLLDLLPLRQCFKSRKLDVPELLDTAIERMLIALRAARLGDGSIARFNGVGSVPITDLAAVTAYDQHLTKTPLLLPETGYARLEAQDLAVVIDVGSAPPEEHSHAAHAGCLAFECSAGQHPFIVGCGHPSQVSPSEMLRARGTAAHSTLVINNAASAQLSTTSFVLKTIGEPGIFGPSNVRYRTAGTQRSGVLPGITAVHDGYAERFGMNHHRSMWLSKAGDQLIGTDELKLGAGRLQDAETSNDEFAIRFHIHPNVEVARSEDGESAICTLPGGSEWHFKCDPHQATLSLEESSFFVGSGGFARTVQIVLRGSARPGVKVDWQFQKPG